MLGRRNRVSNGFEEDSNSINLQNIPTSDEPIDVLYPEQMSVTAKSSTINLQSTNLSQRILDTLDDIYSNRTHRRCVDISYFTLLSMLLSVFFWAAYWLSYNRCQNSRNPPSAAAFCDLEITFEVLTFTLLSITPFLFGLMIFSWIRYSCHNPFDSIRENTVEMKLEGEQWTEQLNDYYAEHRLKSCRCKQKRELRERGYGYIILSPHGIVLDELILLSARENIINNGVLLDQGKLLKITFKKSWKTIGKKQFLIHLPENFINREAMIKLMHLLKTEINVDTVFPINS